MENFLNFLLQSNESYEKKKTENFNGKPKLKFFSNHSVSLEAFFVYVLDKYLTFLHYNRTIAMEKWMKIVTVTLILAIK